MTIHLPQDLEASVNAEVLSGHYASADDVVADAVRLFLRQKVGQTAAQPEEAPAQWADRLQAWINTHPVRPIELDDSRESIYAGCGE